MPFQFEFDANHRVLRARFSGVVDDAELHQFYAAIPAYLQRTGARAGITDLSDVTNFQVSPAAITALATSSPAAKDRLFARIMVAPTPHEFGLSRMFQILGEQTRPSLLVVHTREEAFAALNLKNPHFEPLDPQ